MTTLKAPGGYSGVERRRMARRIKNEQRDLVRWEPAQHSRRNSHGRRAYDGPRYTL